MSAQGHESPSREQGVDEDLSNLSAVISRFQELCPDLTWDDEIWWPFRDGEDTLDLRKSLVCQRNSLAWSEAHPRNVGRVGPDAKATRSIWSDRKNSRDTKS